ncbi:transcriptional regulator of acetoin/glycerol metabolism [Neobacillus niacini]|uniref:sigma-54-dependent Fis family transcriptional regulator n=1 Tax=Neobacillus niacini TaxID=86668 RepID=UPI00277E242A|nr:sigma 54-interacting transcriptional regulator [Neobacillus niacini]MDQ1002674.1 transcriptional regulator of acetoin/glycerol metabolism [Neobacillus niacini]
MSIYPLWVYEQIPKNTIYFHKERQYKNWQNYLLDSKQNENQLAELPETRDIILHSWDRCKANKDLNPLIEGSIKNITDDKLKEIRDRNEVFQLAQPILQKVNQELAHSHHLLKFCDSNGTILEFYGDTSLLHRIGNSLNANKGAIWSENYAGTNAIGTSIELKQPIQIFSSEHFAYGCHELVCSAIPIMNPFTSQVVGVINLATTLDKFYPFSMMETMKIVNNIERFLFQSYFRAQEMLISIYTESINKFKNHIVVMCDPNGKILWQNNDSQIVDMENIILKATNEITANKEWEEEVMIASHRYDSKFKKIFWHNQYIGLIAILEKKYNVHDDKYTGSNTAKYSFHHIIGKSDSFKKVINISKIASATDATILITGESGTGKELIASAIHQASNRANYPFITLNCAAIPKDLLASELFGYVAGAFTGANPKGNKGKFELAHKGTLFLDEIGEIPLESQVHLLRVIQEQEIVRIGDHKKIPIDVRIIAATNKKIPEEIELGNFRLDLYYRLNVIPIELPSLHQRMDDIPILVQHFIKKLSVKKHQGPYQVQDNTMDILKSYSWPGNIRELENIIEYVINFAENGIIRPEDLPRYILSQQKNLNSTSELNPVQQAELEWILDALKRSDNNITRAAKELQLSRSTIYRKLNQLGYDIKTLN